MLYRRHKAPTDLGKVSHIKSIGQTSLEEIAQALTLRFIDEGRKLVFIDELVYCHQFASDDRGNCGFSRDRRLIRHPALDLQGRSTSFE